MVSSNNHSSVGSQAREGNTRDLLKKKKKKRKEIFSENRTNENDASGDIRLEERQTNGEKRYSKIIIRSLSTITL